MKLRKIHFCLFLLIQLLHAYNIFSFTQPAIILKDQSEEINIAKYAYLFEDKSGKANIQEILKGIHNNKFFLSQQEVPNFSTTNSVVWCKILVKNQSHSKWFLEIGNPVLESVEIYHVIYKGLFSMKKANDYLPYSHRDEISNSYLFPLPASSQEVQTYYLRIQSKTPLQFPIKIMKYGAIASFNHKKDLLNGIYFGFMLLMILYNLFLFFSIRDQVYLFYVINTSCLALLNAYLKGYAFEFFWPDLPWINHHAEILAPLVSISSIVFTIYFLHTKKTIPFFHKGLFILLASCILSIVFNFTELTFTSNILIQINGLGGAIYLWMIGIIAYKRGYTEAKFYVVAWTFLLVGIVLFQLQIINVLPYNIYTANAVQIGSGIECLLLSFALADKINTYKKEKAIAQKMSLKSLEEKEKIIKEQNKMLEKKVKERTRDLEINNIELNRIIDKVKRQTKIIEQKNKDITDSIQYARKIQNALLPLNNKINNSLKDYFIFYQPKDIVSGDFYWVSENCDKILIAVIDCTGHGVPGAFMSMIGNNMLNDIVNRRGITEPNLILKELHHGIITILQQDESGNPDGMDISICAIDKASKQLLYSGAKSPLFIIQDGEMHNIRGDKNSIGGFQINVEREFVRHSFDLRKPTTFYLFTDGYRDQFGGRKNGHASKFLMKRFKELIYEIHHRPMNMQRQIIERTINDWMADYEQTDDILILGVNFNYYSESTQIEIMESQKRKSKA